MFESLCWRVRRATASLVTTAAQDNRVVPWHSFKFAAALQGAQRCGVPTLLRVETRAGHGAGKPVWMQVEQIADQWAFAAAALGITVILAGSPDPVEVVEDLGADWADLILEANRERPEDAHRVLLAAHGAFQAITQGWLPAD